jgi:hypothetical protein
LAQGESGVQFGQDGMGSNPATPQMKHASCFPPSRMPASIEISMKLIEMMGYCIQEMTYNQ